MSYARKRHASMMESQKKAAEEAAESLLAATASVSRPPVTVEPSVAANEPAAVTHTQATASVQHDDFAEDSSDTDSEAGGIAFLQAASAGAKKAKVPTAKASTPTSASSANNAPSTPGAANNAAAGGSSQSAPGVVSMQRMHWTKEMDALLLHIVPIYDAKDWVSIAKHMGGDVTNEQCRNRWCCKVDPSLNTCKSGPWEPEEENRMRELIQQYTNHPEQDKRGRRRYRDSVHWGAVAKELNRSQKDCRSKWTTMQRSVTIQDMKKGPFSPEEDAILLQRVAEWGDKGQGIWKALEQELGRPSNNIGNRYRKLLKTYHTGQAEASPAAAEDQAPDYLEVDSERKLAVALAPAISASQAADVEAPLREAAVAAAAVLAGKKRGRPRINPLPLSLEDPMDGPSSSSRGYVGRHGSGKRTRTDELAEAMEGADGSDSPSHSAAASVPVHGLAQGASSSSSASAESAPPAPGMPVNASAELAAGRTKIGRSSFWNEERDALLVEAVQLYGKDWNKISAHVGEGANSDRCWQRWNRYLRPEAMICKTDPWTTEELIKLEELVLTHINNPHKRRAGRSTSRTTIDWTSISQLMGRTYMDCKGKWKKIKAFNMKKGPFTEEEDALIQQQLLELGIPLDAGDSASLTGEGSASGTGGAGAGAGAVSYPSGFWEELSALLNRPPEILRARVRNLRNGAVVR